ncbi:MAG: hypothetical protein GXY58_06995 [Planctomycetaceae bacterium]|nr:hypothetical protein [Planctomycetaceae bacterium]
MPDPVVQFAAREASCPNLAIVTASHNPGRYNGVKFLVGGRPAIPDLMAARADQEDGHRPARAGIAGRRLAPGRQPRARPAPVQGPWISKPAPPLGTRDGAGEKAERALRLRLRPRPLPSEASPASGSADRLWPGYSTAQTRRRLPPRAGSTPEWPPWTRSWRSVGTSRRTPEPVRWR